MDLPDHTLLDRFAARRDEAAFRALVARHLDLVHAVARRVTANDELARDVSQTTFIRLAERAAMIPRHITLPAWLHRTARSLAVDLVRNESRRRQRELSTTLHSAMADPPEPDWSALSPLVDELVDGLPAADRDVLLLRFYRNESHAAIAGKLGLSESVARKRTSRALEKLRVLLGKKGIATTSMALATLLPAHAATPAPAALMTSVVSAAQGVAPLIPHGFTAALLAMNATQKALAAAAVAFFLASMGYAVRPVTGSVVASLPPSSAATSVSAGIAPRPPRTERPFPATPQERLVRLDQILAQKDDLARRRDYVAFLDQVPPQLFPEIAAHLVEIDPTWRLSPEYQMLFGAWVKVDAPAAVAACSQLCRGQYRQATLRSWGAVDTQSAFAWGRDHPDGLGDVLGGMASVDLPGAVKIAQALPDDQRGDVLRGLFIAMSERQPEAMSRLAPLLGPGPDRSELLARFGEFIATTDPQTVIAMLRDDPDARGRVDPEPLYHKWAMMEPSLAADSLADLPPGSQRDKAIATVCSTIAQTHLADAFDLLGRFPDVATDEVKATMIRAAFWQERALSFTCIPRIAGENIRNATWIAQLQLWRQGGEGSLADEWIAQHPELPEAVRTAVTGPVPKVTDPFTGE